MKLIQIGDRFYNLEYLIAAEPLPQPSRPTDVGMALEFETGRERIITPEEMDEVVPILKQNLCTAPRVSTPPERTVPKTEQVSIDPPVGGEPPSSVAAPEPFVP
jgi:hypothetical protein